MITRAWIILAAIVVYGSKYWPAPLLRDVVLEASGNPAYQGLWILIPHVLLYSTFTAACAAAAWLALSRWCKLPLPELGVSERAISWGLAGGLISVIATLVFFQATQQSGIHWVGLDIWKIGGNAFSNFYEEFIYRGFLLTALTAVFGFWPAVVLSSLAFGFGHEQYPLLLKALILATGVFWCLLVRWTRSLWAPWLSHMGLDTVIDAII